MPMERLPAPSGRSRLQSLAGPAILLVLCAAFCWKLTLTDQYTWIDNPDIARMDVPRLQFQRLAWRQYHEFPLWDPYLWCGQPFLGEIGRRGVSAELAAVLASADRTASPSRR